MDPTTTVRTDALPAVASLLVPGLIAGAPYAALVWYEPHNLGKVVVALPGASAAVGAIVLVGLGFLIESAGSYVEFYVLDRLVCQDTPKERTEKWWRFLRSAWTNEPVGVGYLKRLLITFKFELNTMVACLPAGIGLGALLWFGVLPSSTGVPLLLGCIALGAGLFKAAIDSSNLLAQLRVELLKPTIFIKQTR